MAAVGTMMIMPTTVVSTTTTIRLANHAAPRVLMRARAHVIQTAPLANRSAWSTYAGAAAIAARAMASIAMPR